jgi:RimJ/RimL family protein N-acetyltransferase
MANDTERLADGAVSLRPWAAQDAEALVRLGDDREIWLNLRERFPHPFTLPAAQLWLADQAASGAPPTSLAIVHGDALAGGLLLRRREEVHHVCADLTFWLGRPYQGHGIALPAVRLATAYAFERLGLVRVQAFVFDWNPAAARVLERAAYRHEGRLRSYVQKDGRLGDALLLARLRDDPEPRTSPREKRRPSTVAPV